ncbi:MAG: DNA mismatch repair endonuclease MutL [Methanoculleaceae archaeon]
MTPSIHILDPATAGKIAAGEVVERPASVIKELVENAVDAGAGRITIDITSGGDEITRISVADDGCGMEADDVVLAFRRHATSKIRSLDDLKSIRTLGFRGEALASIAAVSRVELVTRSRSAGEGISIHAEGGKLSSPAPAGAPAGTSVTVTKLFYNTPARKKFLRSARTELVHCIDVIEREALAHPEISWVCTLNGQRRFATPVSGTLIDVIRAIYPRELVRALVPVEMEGEGLAATGYISRPSFTRSRPTAICISINHRPVAFTPLSTAIREGYGTRLPRGRHPAAFIHLTIDPALVDVNVHPTKREVRISGQEEIMEMLACAVDSALRAGQEIRPVPMQKARQRRIPVSRPTGTAGVHETPHRTYAATDHQLRLTEEGAACESGDVIPGMEVLGQFARSYIVARETEGETLYLIDQHAAHERILYEQISHRAGERADLQELISPAVIHLTPAEHAAIPEVIPLLEKEGFEIEPFGGRSWTVTAVPVVLGAMRNSGVVRDIISEFITGRRRGDVDDREALIRLISCRGAIKAETSLTQEQMERLISQLRRCRQPLTCPHGRPTILAFPRSRVDRLFLRR